MSVTVGSAPGPSTGATVNLPVTFTVELWTTASSLGRVIVTFGGESALPAAAPLDAPSVSRQTRTKIVSRPQRDLPENTRGLYGRVERLRDGSHRFAGDGAVRPAIGDPVEVLGRAAHLAFVGEFEEA